MKKFVKAMSVFAALALLSAGFVACDDDSDDPTPAVKPTDDTGSKPDAGEGSKPGNTDPVTYTCTGCGTAYDTEAEKDNCAKQVGCPKYVAPVTGPITLDFGALKADIVAAALFEDGTKLTENKTFEANGLTLNFLASSKYAFKYNQDAGLTIKGDAFKITGIDGTYDAVVTWAIAGSKAAGDRNLSVNGGAAVDNAATNTLAEGVAATTVDNTNTVTDATGDLTFNASNEVVIKTIVITKK